MVCEMLGTPPNTMVGRAMVLRFAGRASEWMSRVTGKEPRISEESAVMVNASIVCSSDKAIRELGYKIVPVETMLKSCVDWMIAEKLLSPRAPFR
jgi:dihydroflavonol-4-reductase